MTSYATGSSTAVPPGGFVGASVLVVGDLMLDRYLIGDVNRISPEAPVPIVAVKRRWATAGGAGNVALNVAGLGARAIVAGVVGDDSAGRSLLDILSSSNVVLRGVLTDATRCTTCKTRVMSGIHQITRIDEESSGDLHASTSAELFQRVTAILDEGVGAIILSDYAKGVLGRSFTRAIITECAVRKISVFVDPKRTDYKPYSRATCITPNRQEFEATLMAMHIPHHDHVAAGRLLLKRVGCAALLVTEGADGMTLISPDYFRHFPALAEEVFDVCGAGDTVIATLATASAGGLDLARAVELSNSAASIVVRRVGTVAVNWEELIAPGRETPRGSDRHTHLRRTTGDEDTHSNPPRARAYASMGDPPRV